MPRASLLQSNFSGGELSPALALGRVDIAKYNNGLRRLENCALTIQGGAKRRPGTRFIAAAKLQDRPCRLIDFVYNRGQAYMLELGDGYLRFFKDRTAIPAVEGGTLEVESPYVAAQVPSVNFVQKADTAFFAHEAVTPYRLQRFSDQRWGFGPTPFITAPFEEQGNTPSIALTFSGNSIGTTVLTNSSSAIFLPSDVGRHIVYQGGDALVTEFDSAQEVKAQIFTPFPSTTIPLGWTLTGSPQASIRPSAKGPVAQSVNLSSDYTYEETPKNIEQIGATTSSFTVKVTSHGYAAGKQVRISGTADFNGDFTISSVPDGNNFTIIFANPGNSQTGSGGTVVGIQASTGGQAWRAEDLGKYVSINAGLVQITAVLSSTTVSAKVLRELTSDVPAGANSWTLEAAAWGGIKGYPRAVSINGQRLMYAGSPGYPQHLWASAIQEYLNFSFGTNDDEAFRFELDGPRNSPIRHLAQTRQLIVLTEADEMSLKGGQDKPITPTNIQKTDESTTGSAAVRPVKVGNEIIFVQAAGKKLSACAYRYEIDGFASPDRTVFASHITGTGLVQIAHQKEPDSTLYAIRTDGQMAVCAYDVDQEVTGWGRWITQGSYESIATLPTAIGEDAYVAVRRSVGGADVRYIEVVDQDMLVDCGISQTVAQPKAVWDGLAHLEGKTVQAMADGAYVGEYIVASGQVTLPSAVRSVQIGLGYTSLIETLQIEIGGNGTTAQGSQIHVNEVILRVLDTKAAVINGYPQEFRRFGADLLDQPPPNFTGDIRSTTLSDQIYKTKLVIEQPYPLPFHLLDIIRRVSVND